MRAGFIQLAPVLGEVEQTIEIIERLLPQAEAADILVLPELCNSGYNFTSREQAEATAEDAEHGRFVKYLTSVCQRLKLNIVAGLNERQGDKLYNSAILVGPTGTLGKYRKLHLFLNEKDLFEPGDLGLPIFEVGGCRLGIAICFDWVFPEVWRVLALKGADLICHPSNLVIPGMAQRAVPIHSLCNRVYSITANRFGTERDLTFTGRSMVVTPRGETLVEAAASEEEVQVVEIDPAFSRDKSFTARNHAFEDRRPEEYRSLGESRDRR